MSGTTTDVLGEPWTSETIHFPPDEEGQVVATLVSRRAAEPTNRAVLYVHGFSDYFFQTAYAEWWLERGYDFYAVDLRKYGRSLLAHQTPAYVTDLREHFPELDSAWHRVTERDGHDHVVLSAHSTGGLVCSLWAQERQVALAGMVLNSPWFDLQGKAWMRSVGTFVLDQVGRRRPRRVLGTKAPGLYGRSLHRDHEGEWDFDPALKPLDSLAVHLGWLRAIRRGHAELHRGLDLRFPVLVLSSDRTTWPTEMGEDVHTHDIVLDVEQIRRWSPALGRHVTYVAVPGARHDVVLSRPDVRARAYDELERWRTAYVDR
ncbi:alpha/beta hydrolase [Nocardioides euryhalodurans]|uniref:Alpha/beta hydrolase n=1 Tax=Nocardioides euryhalodurans TaxID=2518370 RepID=A0A4P7GGV1_9ACTN|nr:alpha/beta hydrolase [Nocardioides euryhalodurans]QBR91100.1 alpha/beta hydrolase [Nocardioides euryhalodurans]